MEIIQMIVSPIFKIVGFILSIPLIILGVILDVTKMILTPFLKTRGRKIFGDVRERLGRTALVSSAIFIGVTGTIALFSMSDILVRQLNEDIQAEELPMITVFTTINSDEPLDNQAYLDRIAQVEGVTDTLGIVAVFARFKSSPDDEDFESIVINGFDASYEEGLPLVPMRLLEGGRYPEDGMREVVLEQRMAEDYEFSVGDSIYFSILSPSNDPAQAGVVGTLEEWKVVGLVFHPYAGVTGGGAANQSIYATVDDANYISGQKGLGGVAVRFTDYEVAQAQQETLGDVIANETPYVPMFIQAEDPEQNQLVTGTQTLTGTMSFLAIVALVVSGFLVINVISSIVVEQKRLIGVMKSMGANWSDNFYMYSGIAFTYGMIGVIPGVILGIPGGNAAAHGLSGQLGILLEGFQISPFSIILGIVVGLLIPVLSAVLPVFFGTRIKILEAMTDLGIDANYGTGPFARVISILPVPITVRQGLSNVSLKKVRLAFTVVTLSIAVGAFMGIFAFFSNITSGIDVFLDSFNVEIGLFPSQGEDPARIYEIVQTNFQTEENNVVSSIEPGFQLQVEFEGYEPVASAGGPPGIFAYGFDVNSDTPAFNFTLDEGDPLSDANRENGVIFSSQLANNMEVEIGDTVVLKVPGNKAELVLVGISNYPLDQIWIDWRTLALVAGYTSAGSVESPIEIPAEAQAFVPYASPLTLGEGEVTALGFSSEAGQFLGSMITEGGFYENPQQVVISKALADSQNLSVGDTLTLASTQSAGTNGEYTVAGILDVPPQMAGDAIPSEFVSLNWHDLAVLDGQTFEQVPLPQGYFIITNLDDPSIKELDNVMDDMTDSMLNAGISMQGFNFVELVEQINAAFVTIQVILQAVAFLIAVVGALGLFTTLSMSVFERQKEIGVMRSIGAGSMTVASQFLTEGLVVGFIAWVVGLPLGYLIMVILFGITGFGETFAASFPPESALLGLIGMLFITTVASLWPSLSASRKTVSDILRYQ